MDDLSTTWQVLVGDVLEQLATLPDESVHCVVTSPPYWGLRDYGVDGMIGLEPTLAEHLAKLVEVFAEVRRVLRSDGTLWLNYGDAYSQGTGARKNNPFNGSQSHVRHQRAAGDALGSPDSGLAAKQRLLLPARVALALQDSGWWVRSEIVWAKGLSFCPTYSGSCMPSSVRDRPTDSHEMLYLLCKGDAQGRARYFYDADAVREEGATYGRQNSNRDSRHQPSEKGDPSVDRPLDTYGTPGRNLRTVWAIPEDERAEYAQFKAWKAAQQGELTSTWCINPKGYKEAHFATYPPKLVEPCVKAGTSERGACSECGAPWRRVVERTYTENTRGMVGNKLKAVTDEKVMHAGRASDERKDLHTRTAGWEPTCKHTDAPTVPCVVLDPFSGSGTTGAVAVRLGRSYVGIELNPEYANLSRKRIGRAAADIGHGGTVTADEDERAAQLGLW